MGWLSDGWLSCFWKETPRRPPSHALPDAPRDGATELAELAALIESDDIGEAKLERIATLLGQTDPNRKQF